MSVRRWPEWRIVKEMKRRKVRQLDVALALGVSASFVHDTISRRKPTTNKKAEEVWGFLEKIMNGDLPAV